MNLNTTISLPWFSRPTTKKRKKKRKRKRKRKLVLLQNRYEGFSWKKKKKSPKILHRHIIVKGIFFWGKLPYFKIICPTRM
jgi:hypothetical protein